MSELASMAANKSTTNNVTNITSTSTSSSPAPQANSPVLSSASSLVSPDSSATNPISSPEAQTPQNTPQNNSPLTTANIADESEDNSASTTPTNQINANALVDASGIISASLDNNNILKTLTDDDETKCDSPLIDTKSSGSVHEKASMFERKLSEEQISTQAGAPAQHHHPNPLSLLNNSTLNLTPATVARLESIYGKKTEEIYGRTTSTSTTSLMERVVVETGQFFFFKAIILPHIMCKYKYFKWAVLLVALYIVNATLRMQFASPLNVDFSSSGKST